MSSTGLRADLEELRETFRRYGVVNWELVRRGETSDHAKGYGDGMLDASRQVDELLEAYGGTDGQ